MTSSFPPPSQGARLSGNAQDPEQKKTGGIPRARFLTRTASPPVFGGGLAGQHNLPLDLTLQSWVRRSKAGIWGGKRSTRPRKIAWGPLTHPNPNPFAPWESSHPWATRVVAYRVGVDCPLSATGVTNPSAPPHFWGRRRGIAAPLAPTPYQSLKHAVSVTMGRVNWDLSVF